MTKSTAGKEFLDDVSQSLFTRSEAMTQLTLPAHGPLFQRRKRTSKVPLAGRRVRASPASPKASDLASR
jgi:hypothetical protein